MKRITLMMVFAAAVAGSSALAQDPTPPVAPARPALPPSRVERPTVAPRATMEHAWEANLEARDAARAAMEIAREDMRGALAAGFDSWNRPAQEPMYSFTPLPPLPSMPAMPAMPALAPMAEDYGFGYTYRVGPSADGFRFRTPPAAWAQGDPADSIYKLARTALNSGEYGRAARLFADIRQQYPKSAYQVDSPYWEAYARYKIGTTDELQTAAKLLEPIATRTVSTNGTLYETSRRSTSDTDVATLYNRINGVLAQRGDRDAAEKIAKAASQAGAAPCDNEDVQVRVEAMNALSQMDPTAALPLLRRVLDRKDECSNQLRQRAVFMLGRRSDTESAQLLVNAARTDPSPNVRAEAINTLPRLSGDVGLTALEEMLRTEQDERMQRAIVRALTSSDNARARTSMRALIDRKDAPLALRVEAVNSFNNDRATSDDAAYLRSLYGRADNDRLKEAVIQSVARMGGAENDKWVLSIAQNQNEPSQLRAAAISRLMRSNTSMADMGKLYDGADSYNIRSQIISVLSSRKEPEATDKLLDIVKNSTVVQLRSQAINALTRKNDPRTTQLLMDLIDKGKP